MIRIQTSRNRSRQEGVRGKKSQMIPNEDGKSKRENTKFHRIQKDKRNLQQPMMASATECCKHLIYIASTAPIP